MVIYFVGIITSGVVFIVFGMSLPPFFLFPSPFRLLLSSFSSFSPLLSFFVAHNNAREEVSVYVQYEWEL